MYIDIFSMKRYMGDLEGLMAAMGSMWIFSLIICIAAVVGLWRVFSKAGEPGWAAIIPLYNTYVLFKIIFGNGWKFLLVLIPIYGIYLAIVAMFKLAKSFGKGVGFGFGLLFLSPIFLLILAFDNSTYSPAY